MALSLGWLEPNKGTTNTTPQFPLTLLCPHPIPFTTTLVFKCVNVQILFAEAPVKSASLTQKPACIKPYGTAKTPEEIRTSLQVHVCQIRR